MNHLPSDIQATDLQAMLQGITPPFVLDVREGWECDICQIPGSKNIPLTTLPSRLEEIPREQPVVVICHHSGRSARAAAWLKQNGYTAVSILAGGVDAWARQIDPTMETY